MLETSELNQEQFPETITTPQIRKLPRTCSEESFAIFDGEIYNQLQTYLVIALEQNLQPETNFIPENPQLDGPIKNVIKKFLKDFKFGILPSKEQKACIKTAYSHIYISSALIESATSKQLPDTQLFSGNGIEVDLDEVITTRILFILLHEFSHYVFQELKLSSSAGNNWIDLLTNISEEKFCDKLSLKLMANVGLPIRYATFTFLDGFNSTKNTGYFSTHPDFQRREPYLNLEGALIPINPTPAKKIPTEPLDPQPLRDAQNQVMAQLDLSLQFDKLNRAYINHIDEEEQLVEDLTEVKKELLTKLVEVLEYIKNSNYSENTKTFLTNGLIHTLKTGTKLNDSVLDDIFEGVEIDASYNFSNQESFFQKYNIDTSYSIKALDIEETLEIVKELPLVNRTVYDLDSEGIFDNFIDPMIAIILEKFAQSEDLTLDQLIQLEQYLTHFDLKGTYPLNDPQYKINSTNSPLITEDLVIAKISDLISNDQIFALKICQELFLDNNFFKKEGEPINPILVYYLSEKGEEELKYLNQKLNLNLSKVEQIEAKNLDIKYINNLVQIIESDSSGDQTIKILTNLTDENSQYEFEFEDGIFEAVAKLFRLISTKIRETNIMFQQVHFLELHDLIIKFWGDVYLEDYRQEKNGNWKWENTTENSGVLADLKFLVEVTNGNLKCPAPQKNDLGEVINLNNIPYPYRAVAEIFNPSKKEIYNQLKILLQINQLMSRVKSESTFRQLLYNGKRLNTIASKLVEQNTIELTEAQTVSGREYDFLFDPNSSSEYREWNKVEFNNTNGLVLLSKEAVQEEFLPELNTIMLNLTSSTFQDFVTFLSAVDPKFQYPILMKFFYLNQNSENLLTDLDSFLPHLSSVPYYNIDTQLENSDNTLKPQISEVFGLSVSTQSQVISPRDIFAEIILQISFYRIIELNRINDQQSVSDALQIIEEQVTTPCVAVDIALTKLLKAYLKNGGKLDGISIDTRKQWVSLYYQKWRAEPITLSLMKSVDTNLELDRYLEELNKIDPKKNPLKDKLLEEYFLENGFTIEAYDKILPSLAKSKLKKKIEIDAYYEHILNLINGQETYKKADWILWLMGIQQDKPESVIAIEEILDCHLDELQYPMQSDQISDRVVEAVFFGNNGFFAKENEEIINYLISQIIDTYIDDTGSDIQSQEGSDSGLIKDILEAVLKVALTSANDYKKINVIKKLAYFLASTSSEKPAIAEFIKIIANSYGIVGVRIAQIIASQPKIKETHPEIYSALAELKEAAKYQTLDEVVMLVKSNPKLFSNDIQLEFKPNCLIASGGRNSIWGVTLNNTKMVLKTPKLSEQVDLVAELVDLLRLETAIAKILSNRSLPTIPNLVERLIQNLKLELLSDPKANSLLLTSALSDKTDVKTPLVNPTLSANYTTLEQRVDVPSLTQIMTNAEFNDTKPFLQTLRAILIMLSKGILHADTHSSNFLYDSNSDTVYVIDLDLLQKLPDKADWVKKLATILLDLLDGKIKIRQIKPIFDLLNNDQSIAKIVNDLARLVPLVNSYSLDEEVKYVRNILTSKYLSEEEKAIKSLLQNIFVEIKTAMDKKDYEMLPLKILELLEKQEDFQNPLWLYNLLFSTIKAADIIKMVLPN